MNESVVRFHLPRVAAIGAVIASLSCAPAAMTPATTTAASAPVAVSTTVPLTSAQRRWVDQTLSSLTLRERVGQMVTVWTLGDYTNSRDTMYAQLIKWVEQDKVGGLTMSLGTPIEVAAKLNDLQRRSKIPLLVSADLEPGLGRLETGIFTHYLLETGGATAFPPAMAIAATGRDEDAFDVARVIAREGRAAGIHVNFAPVVDVNNNPANPVINVRSFGEDPERVARLSRLFVQGTMAGGQYATAKHFPGHGDTDVDSHVGLPVVNATMSRLSSLELVPFRAAIDAGAAMVMTAHVSLPAIDSAGVPATLSPRIITGLLRDSLNFRGVTITDAMTMEGVGKGYSTEQSSVLAVQAGADILLKPSDPTQAIDAVVRAVERGEISRGRIDSAARHVLELKARMHITESGQVSLDHLRDVVGSPEHRAIAAGVATRAITLLRDSAGIVPLKATGRALVVQYMPETEVRAGRILGNAVRAGRTRASAGPTALAKISPAATRDLLDSLGRMADSSSVVVIATFVRRVEGEGRFAIPKNVADWIDAVSRRRPTVVVAFGNPYVIRQFPGVSSYVATYGVGDELERAAARALLGEQNITGKVPVTLPGFFNKGDGLRRP
ncbi:MAG TPA: glycoside hydrolase family 3 N-terminal domain-containing protein [Gemmatimonadaceae bacterium]|nr:glycoside hydrolase family 3 N-terminal domain-containing protein [Gemmatimonadaceae bacterium]